MAPLYDSLHHFLHNFYAPRSSLRFRKFRAAITAAGFAGLLTASCQSSVLLGDRLDEQSEKPQTASPSPDSLPGSEGGFNEGGLKLGAMLPVTADLGQMGRPMLQVLPLLMDTVNRCGGVNNAPVSLVVEDQAAKPLEGAVTLTKLVEADRVSAIVGAFSSNVSVAALPVAVRSKVLLISPASTSSTLTDRAQQGTYKGFWARTVPSDPQEAVALAQLAQKRGFRNVVTLTLNSPDAIAFEQAFIAAFEKRGGKVRNKTQPLRYAANADPYTLEELSYAAFSPYDRPDAVVGILDRSTGAALLKSAAELGLTAGIPVLLTREVRVDAFVQRVGKNDEGKALLAGAIGTIPAADGPGFSDLTEKWQEQFGSVPTPFVAQTWDAAALVMLAAQAANSNDREDIQSKLKQVANPPGMTVSDVCEGLALLKQGQEINYDGASGKVDIDQAGNVKGDYDVWRVEEQGQFKQIDRIRPE